VTCPVNRIVYLHGFASSPQSSKAQSYRKRFAEKGLALEIPTLDGGDFTHLSITGQLQIVHAAVAGEATVLIGSSLGGYLAALYAAELLGMICRCWRACNGADFDAD